MNIKLIKTSKRAPVTLTIAAASLISVTHADSLKTVGEGETHAGSTEQAIAPIVFRDGSTHMRVLDNINGVAISEGDIIFGDAKKFFNNTKERSVRGLSNYVYGTVWPNGVVPYRISSQLSKSAEGKVRAAITAWNATGAVTMVERTEATASAYPNYIDFVDADQCASWVGFQNDGAQSIYTGDKCSEGSMIHEIGHAMGLLHEHTRPDRDSFVKINWNSISTDKAHNFDVLEDGIPLGDYDYSSIMHYGTHFFSNDGNPTISSLQNTGVKLGQREFISDGDKNSMITLYQSEYSLVSSSSASAAAGGTLQLDMFVTNNSDMGANTMRLETTVPTGSTLVSFSSPSWVCQQNSEGENVVCQSPALAESSSSTVSVTLSAPATEGIVSFDTTLSANTFDTDSSNNRDKSSTTVVAESSNLLADEKAPAPPPPTIAAATPASVPVAAAANASTNTATSTFTNTATSASTSTATIASASSGGGSFGALGLLLLLCGRRNHRTR